MITRIAISNFKAFRKAEIITTALNLFTGMNGMGKSSFIQSLLLLRQSNTITSPLTQFLLILKGEIIDIGKGKDAYNIHADSDFIRFEVDFENKSIINSGYKFIPESDVLYDVEKETDIFKLGAYSLFNADFKYLKAERIIPVNTYKANLSAVEQSGFLGYNGENVPLFIALNKLEPLKINSVKHPDAISNNLIANIDAWMNEITPGTHVISTYFNELDLVRLSYQFDDGDDVTPEFSPVNVGFGFTYVLPVITAVLSAKKGDLIIIENPESHLHPQGQAKLGELFAKAANDGVQLIIESHSDHLLNGIRVAVKKGFVKSDEVSIFYFERNKDSKEHVSQIIQPKIDEDGRIDNWPEGFFDEWDKMLDKLF